MHMYVWAHPDTQDLAACVMPRGHVVPLIFFHRSFPCMSGFPIRPIALGARARSAARRAHRADGTRSAPALPLAALPRSSTLCIGRLLRRLRSASSTASARWQRSHGQRKLRPDAGACGHAAPACVEEGAGGYDGPVKGSRRAHRASRVLPSAGIRRRYHQGGEDAHPGRRERGLGGERRGAA